MLRRICIVGGILAALFILPTCHAQVIELACPVGTTSVQSLQTTDTTNGQIRQNYCVDKFGIVTQNVGTLISTGAVTLGNGSAFAPVTFSNHNNIFWAGPGNSPTIDQAIAQCTVVGLVGCRVDISPGYTGPESANLFTNSMGFKVYNGNNATTIIDYRANAATPGNPAAAPLYPFAYGGRAAGELTRTGTHYFATGTLPDSIGTSTNFMWLTNATFPTNAGGLVAVEGDASLTDTITVGSSATEIAAISGEVDANATSSDNPLYSVYGVVSGIDFTRVGASQNIIEAKAYGAKTCSNSVSAPAKFFYCYGLKADQQLAGTYRNFSIFSKGDWLTETGTKFWANDTGAASNIAASPNGATESGQTVTFTMTAVCAFTAGQQIQASGVGVAGYNNSFVVNPPGCNGTSSFTVFAPGTSGLAGSGGGTITTFTPRVMTTYSASNTVLHQPLADANGWHWQTQGGSDLFTITSTLVSSKIAHVFSGDLKSVSPGAAFVGDAGAEFAGLYLFEGGAVTGRGGDTVCQAVSATHTLNCSYNNDGTAGAGFPVGRIIASGTATMTTAAISAGNCGTTVTVAATNVLATDTIEVAFNAAPAGTNAGLTQWPTAGNVNFAYCPGVAETPAAATINWKVVR